MVDFVSLGTNDLAQYTMATDRMAGELADLLDPWQPALLDLVAAHRARPGRSSASRWGCAVRRPAIRCSRWCWSGSG